jgi:hypothetical protein
MQPDVLRPLVCPCLAQDQEALGIRRVLEQDRVVLGPDEQVGQRRARDHQLLLWLLLERNLSR